VRLCAGHTRTCLLRTSKARSGAAQPARWGGKPKLMVQVQCLSESSPTEMLLCECAMCCKTRCALAVDYFIKALPAK
jgi:hypothetical protein